MNHNYFAERLRQEYRRDLDRQKFHERVSKYIFWTVVLFAAACAALICLHSWIELP